MKAPRRKGAGSKSGATDASPPPGLAARRGALRLLADVLDRGRMLDEGVLGGRPEERAQAVSLAQTVLRRMGEVDALLASFVEKRPKPPVNHALRMMIAEVVFADTPDHAAIDMAVRATKAAGAPRMAGLVNAVGRRLTRDGLPDMSGQTNANMPMQFRTALLADWDAETVDRMAASHQMPPPLDLTPRDPAEAERLSADLGGAVLANGSIRLHAPGQISLLPGFSDGRWWVQDAAASLPAQLLPAMDGLDVLDLCSAPGGKTMQLASAGARVTALDASKRRQERVRENLGRTQLDATLVTADARSWEPETAFDAILLDAPCSASGTVRRHPDLPHRHSAESLESLIGLQRALLDRAFTWLKPGGTLVYCTCSLFKAEGEGQLAAFLDRTPAARQRTVELPDLPWAVSEGCLRTRPDHWPDLGGLDGFFAAVIERVS
ncbi:MAG: transcription antitermination factor NusB [Pseudomonadota bacterium]